MPLALPRVKGITPAMPTSAEQDAQWGITPAVTPPPPNEPAPPSAPPAQLAEATTGRRLAIPSRLPIPPVREPATASASVQTNNVIPGDFNVGGSRSDADIAAATANPPQGEQAVPTGGININPAASFSRGPRAMPRTTATATAAGQNENEPVDNGPYFTTPPKDAAESQRQKVISAYLDSLPDPDLRRYLFGAYQSTLDQGKGPADALRAMDNAAKDAQGTPHWASIFAQGPDGPSLPAQALRGTLGVLAIPGDLAKNLAKAAGAPPIVQQAAEVAPYFTPGGAENRLARIGLGTAGTLGGKELAKQAGLPEWVGEVGGGLLLATQAERASRIAAALGRNLTPAELSLSRSFFAGITPPDNMPQDFRDALKQAGKDLELQGQTPEAAKPLPGQTGLFGETVDEGGRINAPTGPSVSSDPLRMEQGTQSNLLGEPVQPGLGQTAAPIEAATNGAKEPVMPATEEAAPPTPEAINSGMADPGPPAIGTRRTVVPARDLTYRPDLFQTRDTTEGQPFSEARVRQLVDNWDPALFTPPTVVADPENPGKYIVTAGQHRTEAFKRVMGADANLEVNVSPQDVRDPAQLARAQLEADASNTGTKALNVREEIRNLQRAQAAGQDQGQIESLLGKNGSYIEKLENIARVGPTATDAVVADPAITDHVSEIGRAMRLYGVNEEDANGLLRRLIDTNKGTRPTSSAYRETLDKFGKALSQIEQTGLFDTGQFEGSRGQLLDLINRHAELQRSLNGERNSLVRARNSATKLAAGGNAEDKAAADRLVSLAQAKVDALDAEIKASEEDVGRAVRGDFSARPAAQEGQGASQPPTSATATPSENGAAPGAATGAPPATPPGGGTAPPPPERPSRFPPGTEDPDLEWLIGAVEGAGAARPSLLDLRKIELSKRVGEAMARLQSEGENPENAFRKARQALRGQLAADLFDVSSLPGDNTAKALHRRIIEAVQNGDVRFFTGNTASEGLEKLLQGVNIAPHEAEALGQVFGPRLQFAIEDMGEIFKVQRRVEGALSQKPLPIEALPASGPFNSDVIAEALRKAFPGIDQVQLSKVAERLTQSGRLKVTAGGNGKLALAFTGDDSDALGEAIAEELGVPRRTGLSGPKLEFPPDLLPPTQATGLENGITGEGGRAPVPAAGDRAPLNDRDLAPENDVNKPLPGQPNLYLANQEGATPPASAEQLQAQREAMAKQGIRPFGEPVPPVARAEFSQDLPPAEVTLSGEGQGNLSHGEPGPPSTLSPEEQARQAAAAEELRKRHIALGTFQDIQPQGVANPGEGLPPGYQTNANTKQAPLPLPAQWQPGHRPMWESVGDAAANVAALLAGRALQTGFDLSFPLRQAGVAIRHAEWWQAWDDMAKSLLSEDFATRHDYALKNLPYKSEALHLSPLPGTAGANFTASEEAFMSRFVARIPVLRESARAVVSFINDLRANLVNNYGRNMARAGYVDQKELDAYANYVNRLTGWGKLGNLEPAVGALNQVFYSVRRNVAMVQAPAYMFHANSNIRREAMMDFLSFFGVGMSTLALAQLSGLADVGYDPNKADFGKIKVGDTRVDLWGGYAQMARLVYGVVNGEIKNPGTDALLAPMGTYFRNKLAPFPGFVVDLAAGHNAIGEKLGSRTAVGDFGPVGNEAWKRLMPLAWSGLIEAARQDGIKGAALGLTGIFGEGTQTYVSAADARDRAAQAQFNKPFDQLLPSERDAVNKSESVQAVVRQSPEVQHLHELQTARNQEVSDSEAKFKEGTLPQKLGDTYHDISLERRADSKNYETYFADQIAHYPVDQLRTVSEGYYGIQKNDANGNFDYDATQQARQDYLDKLSDKPGPNGEPSPKAVMQDYITWIEGRKSDLQRQRDQLISSKKDAGYYADGADTKALDKANPNLDVQGWYFGGGLADPKQTPALQSIGAVDQALKIVQSEGLKNRPVKLDGLSRSVNDTPGSQAAYEAVKNQIDFYQNKAVTQYADQYAQRLHHQAFDQLSKSDQDGVKNAILRDVQLGTPALDAALAWFGGSSTLNSRAALTAYQQMVAKYGTGYKAPNFDLKLAANAR